MASCLFHKLLAQDNPTNLQEITPPLFPPPQDVAELRAQITQFGVHVDVDAPKGQDLARIMEEMRAKYERIALKNQEELKAWHESQVRQNLELVAECVARVGITGYSCLISFSDHRSAGPGDGEHNSPEGGHQHTQ